MNNEGKYNAALERARDLMKNQNPPAFDKNLIETIFPELKEDKDERIRKTIYGWIYTQPSEFFDNGFSKEEMLTWLEKQGENKPTENVEIKFCEGDKVVSNHDGKVYTVGFTYHVTGDNICLHGTNGSHKWVNRDDLDRNYHLWTSEDPEQGQVKESAISQHEDKTCKENRNSLTSKLDADKVIAWLVANIIDFEYYVRLFKKDFVL